MTQNLNFLAQLDDLAVLRIDGEDAVSFLHAQLSNDVSALGTDEARLAAYCNPKGRMLGNLVLWHDTSQPGSALLGLVKADIVEPLLKRLRMFVLRSKVTFSETPLKVYGASRVAHAEPAPALLDTGTAWQLRRQDGLTSIGAPAPNEGVVRNWIIAAEQTEPASLTKELGLTPADSGSWQAQDIQAGLGWIEQSNLELFIPQSVNYDLAGGVSFTKGCYPGQEIVARAHFRGTVKRRALAGHCRLPSDAVLQPGEDIFDAARPGVPAGRIINAAAAPGQGAQPRDWHVFMELSFGDADQADLRALSSDGPAVRLLPLPYSLEPGTAD